MNEAEVDEKSIRGGMEGRERGGRRLLSFDVICSEASRYAASFFFLFLKLRKANKTHKMGL